MSWVASRSSRLIDFLKIKASHLGSIKSIRRALDANSCRVNGKIERFASRRIESGDRIEFTVVLEKKPVSLTLEILFEDEFFQVINKPSGWVCQDAFLQRSLGPCRYLIHRLDKETTGLLLVAKSQDVKKRFITLFEEKAISKLYLALADGVFSPDRAIKESWFVKKKEFAGQTIWGSHPAKQGAYACTHFETIARGQDSTLFACKPITGRTHQIRIHLAELGHPILIDRQYAEKFRCPHSFSRILLHASHLAFTHPITNKPLFFSVPLPRDMGSAIDLVGISSRHVCEFFSKEQKQKSGDKRCDDENGEKTIQSSELFH